MGYHSGGKILDIDRYLWGWIGPNDVDVAIIYDGSISVDKLREHYNSIQQNMINESIAGQIPPEQLIPILEPKFYSADYVESLIRQISDTREDARQIASDLNDVRYTRQQALNRTLIRFVEFFDGRTMGEDEKQHLSALITSPAEQMYFLTGQDYAQDISDRLTKAFWFSEINAMRGEKEGKKQYLELVLAKAREEVGNLPYGQTMLKLDAEVHDSFTTYWRLKRGSEVNDPYGELCQSFLPMSHLVGDITIAHAEAQAMGTTTMELIQVRRGMIRNLHMPPEEAERVTKASKVFYTLEDFVRELSL